MSRLPRRLGRLIVLLCVLIVAAPPVAAGSTSDRHAAAAREGVVVIYAATDETVVRELERDFTQLFPGVRVEYHDLNSVELYQRFLAEAKEGGMADVLWSSAMDLQLKLVNDGHAQPHRSAETATLPDWAVWRDEAFGTTFEPIAMVYNRRLMAADEVPGSHAELLRLLARTPDRYRNRLTAYDPARSGIGLLLQTQDVVANPVVFWRLAEAFGRIGIQTVASTAEMLDQVASGKALLGYNVLGSYALTRATQDPRLGVVFPRDYTLVISRVAFISRQARHPNAARLWLDYLLSPRGQQLLSKKPGFYSVRAEVPADEAAEDLRQRLGLAFRPIVIDTNLLAYLDQMKRRDFLRQWHETIAPLP